MDYFFYLNTYGWSRRKPLAWPRAFPFRYTCDMRTGMNNKEFLILCPSFLVAIFLIMMTSAYADSRSDRTQAVPGADRVSAPTNPAAQPVNVPRAPAHIATPSTYNLHGRSEGLTQIKHAGADQKQISKIFSMNPESAGKKTGKEGDDLNVAAPTIRQNTEYGEYGLVPEYKQEIKDDDTTSSPLEVTGDARKKKKDDD